MRPMSFVSRVLTFLRDTLCDSAHAGRDRRIVSVVVVVPLSLSEYDLSARRLI